MNQKRNTTDGFLVRVPFRVSKALRLLEASILSSRRIFAGIRHARPRRQGVCSTRSLNDWDVGYIAALAILELDVEVFVLACAGILTIATSNASRDVSVI